MANSLGFVNDVEGLAIEKGCKAFVRVFVLSSTLNRDSVPLKLENVRELGFKGEKGRIIVQRSLELLGCPRINYGRVSNFLWRNGSCLAILRHPAASRRD